MLVNLIHNFSSTSFSRQFPEVSTNGIKIVENGSAEIDYDMLVVYEDMPKLETFSYLSGQSVFITGEPPYSRIYSEQFMSQFDKVVSCHPKIKHPNLTLTQQALPWHYGYNYETQIYSKTLTSLRQDVAPIKQKDISVIASSKKMMPGHAQRLKFISKLKSSIGDQIDFFGKQSNFIADKAEGIERYKMTVCIENSSLPHYWTEKIADAFLGFSLPIYHGCTNIDEYFDPRSFITIDINRPDDAIEKIVSILPNIDKIYTERLPYISESRSRILSKYNICNLIEDILTDPGPSAIIPQRTRKEFKPSDRYISEKVNRNLVKIKRRLISLL